MDSLDFPICMACGNQFDVNEPSKLTNCKICDDPRQMVPPSGQEWTTLRDLRQSGKHKNHFYQDDVNKSMWSIATTPNVGIGQRAIFFQTPNGNVLWDCVAFLDEEIIGFINSKGGLAAIVISHPHLYASHAEWAKEFNCPVYVSTEDKQWLCRAGPHLKFIEGKTETILPGVTAIKCGGHFDGSLVLHYNDVLFTADTMMTVPSAFTPHPRAKDQVTYSFLYSIPNKIPLPPSKILGIWNAIKPYNFHTTHGNFVGLDVRDEELKKRCLHSMQFMVQIMAGEGLSSESKFVDKLMAEQV